MASRKVLSQTNEFAHEVVVSSSLFLGLISDVTSIETGKQNGRTWDKNCDAGVVDHLKDSWAIITESTLRSINQRTEANHRNCSANTSSWYSDESYNFADWQRRIAVAGFAQDARRDQRAYGINWWLRRCLGQALQNDQWSPSWSRWTQRWIWVHEDSFLTIVCAKSWQSAQCTLNAIVWRWSCEDDNKSRRHEEGSRYRRTEAVKLHTYGEVHGALTRVPDVRSSNWDPTPRRGNRKDKPVSDEIHAQNRCVRTVE